VQGELQVRGECVFDGYIGRDRAADFDDDWFRTGDVGVIVDGRLALTGRAKDIVVLNGRNFSCAEVETALSDVPEIVPSSTVAAPFIDPATDAEELAVFFAPEGWVGDETAAAALRERLSMALQIQARALVPVDPAEIPRTAIGKPVRPVLGRRLAEGAFPRAIRTGAGPSRDADPARNVLRAAWEPTTVVPAIFTTPGLVLDLSEQDADRSLEWQWPDAELCRPDMLTNRLEAAGPDANIVLPAVSWASVSAAFDMLRSTMRRTAENNTTWTVVTRSDGPARSGLAGAVRSLLAHERRTAPDGITLRHLQILDGVTVDRVATVLAAAWPADVLRLDEHGLCRRVLRTVTLPCASTPHLRPGGRYVVTGGAGGIGRHVCQMLLDEVGARVLVVGRSAAPGIAEGCLYAQADVAVPGRLREAVERFEAETGAPVDGIFHLAGVGDIRSNWTSSAVGAADETTADLLDRMSGEKLAGTIACADLVAERGDARLVIFSSLIGYTGGFGDLTYSVSNAAQQAIFEDLPIAVRERATCLEWSIWRDTGMSRDYPSSALAMAEAGGFRVLDVHAALRALRAALCAGWGHRLMLGVDPEAVSLRSDLADPRTSRLRILVEEVPAAALDQVRQAIHALGLRIPVEMCPVPVLPDGSLTESALARLLDKTAVADNPDNGHYERTPTERALGRLFAEVLQAADPGPEADFVRLGGHSLLAARLASRVEAEFNVELPMVAIFEHPVLGGLAAVIDRARAARAVRSRRPVDW
jgi:acyl carrier protein